MHYSESFTTQSKHLQWSYFAKIVNGLRKLLLQKSSILDVWLGSISVRYKWWYCNTIARLNWIKRFLCESKRAVVLCSTLTNFLVLKLLHSKKGWKYVINSFYEARFPIQGSWFQNHWVAPRSTRPFIPPRLIKWVPEISGGLWWKCELSLRSVSVALRHLNPIHQKGPWSLEFYN